MAPLRLATHHSLASTGPKAGHNQNMNIPETADETSAYRHLQYQRHQRLPNLLSWLEREQPDVVCRQELKTADKSFPARDFDAAGYGVVYQGQKLDYRLKWFEHLIAHAQTLQASEYPVVQVGDFNVVPTDFDI